MSKTFYVQRNNKFTVPQFELKKTDNISDKKDAPFHSPKTIKYSKAHSNKISNEKFFNNSLKSPVTLR